MKERADELLKSILTEAEQKIQERTIISEFVFSIIKIVVEKRIIITIKAADMRCLILNCGMQKIFTFFEKLPTLAERPTEPKDMLKNISKQTPLEIPFEEVDQFLKDSTTEELEDFYFFWRDLINDRDNFTIIYF